MTIQGRGKGRRGTAPLRAWRASWALLAALAAPVGAAPAPDAPGAPEVAACGAANRQTWAELSQAQADSARRHAPYPMVVSRLQGLGAQLARLRDAANRNPRSLADCEQTAQSLAGAREQLEHIVGSPTQVAACAAGNQQTHGELQAELKALQAGDVVPAPALRSALDRLGVLGAALAREGATLADCRRLGAELAEERSQLQRLAPPAPANAPPRSAAAPEVAAAVSTPSACREAQARTYNELAQNYARLVGGGPIAAEWMAPLQSLSERLTRLHASIADASVPGWDCDAVARALAQARSDLAQLVRR